MLCYDSFEILFSDSALLLVFDAFDYFWKENLVLAVAKKETIDHHDDDGYKQQKRFLHQDDAQKKGSLDSQIFVYPSFLGAILINGPFCYEYGFRPLAFKPMMVAKNATTWTFWKMSTRFRALLDS